MYFKTNMNGGEFMMNVNFYPSSPRPFTAPIEYSLHTPALIGKAPLEFTLRYAHYGITTRIFE